MAGTGKPLKIQTSDNIITDYDSMLLCKFSAVINTMVADCENGFGNEDPIPITQATKEIMDLIMVWAKEHKDDDLANAIDLETIDRNDRAGHMSEFDKGFISALTRQQLHGLVKAAVFLDIKQLITLGVQQAILATRGLSVEETRKFFGIKNNLTEETKKKIELEDKWLGGGNSGAGGDASA